MKEKNMEHTKKETVFPAEEADIAIEELLEKMARADMLETDWKDLIRITEPDTVNVPAYLETKILDRILAHTKHRKRISSRLSYFMYSLKVGAAVAFSIAAVLYLPDISLSDIPGMERILWKMEIEDTGGSPQPENEKGALNQLWEETTEAVQNAREEKWKQEAVQNAKEQEALAEKRRQETIKAVQEQEALAAERQQEALEKEEELKRIRLKAEEEQKAWKGKDSAPDDGGIAESIYSVLQFIKNGGKEYD